MAQPREGQPGAIELMPTAREAPPPYEHVSPPLPTYRRDTGEQHGHEDHASRPSYHTLLQRGRRQSANPVEKLYNRVNSTNAVKWGAAMVCLGASVAVLLKFPASSLRPLLVYVIVVAGLHFFCHALSVRPFSATTPRPPLWHFFALGTSTAMWVVGAVALMVAYSRDKEAAVPRGDTAEERKSADNWGNAVLIAGVAGFCALLACLWQWFNTVKLCRRFSESDTREGYKMMWARKEKAKARRAARRVQREQQRGSV